MGTIFKLTESANLALHAMMLLAEDAARPRDTAAMAKQIDSSVHHLSKVMQRLQRGGLVTSIRGPKGGFRLAVNPAKVTLLEVYTAVEGEFEIQHCLMGHPVCNHPNCPLGAALGKAGTEFREILRKTKLSQVPLAAKRTIEDKTC